MVARIVKSVIFFLQILPSPLSTAKINNGCGTEPRSPLISETIDGEKKTVELSADSIAATEVPIPASDLSVQVSTGVAWSGVDSKNRERHCGAASTGRVKGLFSRIKKFMDDRDDER